MDTLGQVESVMAKLLPDGKLLRKLCVEMTETKVDSLRDGDLFEDNLKVWVADKQKEISIFIQGVMQDAFVASVLV